MINWIRSLFEHRKMSASLQPRRISVDQQYSAIYAIGDVHGCLGELKELETKIIVDGRRLKGDKLVVMLGDYVDRGPSSAAVLDHLLQPLPQDFSRLCLMGNHEQMFLKFWSAPSLRADWLRLGGEETLASYGVYLDENHKQPMVSQLRATIPQDHLDFLAGLPVMIRAGDYCFVHAGIDPSLSLDEQEDEILLTSRPQQFDWTGYRGPWMVIHGHTPVAAVDLSGFRINLDIQAYRSGRLAALRICGDRLDVIYSS